MLGSRWRKPINDLLSNLSRSFLILLTIGFGIFGIGIITDSYSILTREINKNYMKTNPASFTVYTNKIDNRLLKAVSSFSYVKEVEPRKTVYARRKIKNNIWQPIRLYIIDDYRKIHIDKIASEKGIWPPKTGDILIERDAVSLLKIKIGDRISIKIPDKNVKQLKAAGIVHAPGLPPASMERISYGYITRQSLKLLGDFSSLNELRIVVAKHSMDRAYIKKAAMKTQKWCIKNGYKINHIDVPKPGTHPHISQLASFLLILRIFGILSLILSAILVVNMVTALMAGQIRQIGVMKSIGAKSSQLAGIYTCSILILGNLALIFAIPAARSIGIAFSYAGAGMLNFNILSIKIPLWSYIIQILIGLLLPLLAGAYPIYKGCKVTAKDVINDYGISGTDFNPGIFAKLPEKNNIFSRPLILSMRNTFRKRGRLIITLCTLSMGGAIFIVGSNVSSSIDKTINNVCDKLNYDIELNLNHYYPSKTISRNIMSIHDVSGIQCWSSGNTVLLTSKNTESNQYTIKAPQSQKSFKYLSLVDGRFLKPDDKNGIMINQEVHEQNPNLNISDKIILKCGNFKARVKIIGIIRQIGAPGSIFCTKEFFAKISNHNDCTNEVFVVTKKHDIKSLSMISQNIEKTLENKGVDVANNGNLPSLRDSLVKHLQTVSLFLLTMSFLTIIIGGLGLLSSMGINVIERMKEIGVMRSIGASPNSILKIFLAEGIVMSIISWIIASLISVPLTIYISDKFGMIFLKTPLDVAISQTGILAWLLISIVITTISCIIPAQKAIKLPVNEILAYE